MSHDGQDEKLIYMANQITTFFNSQSEDKAVAEISNHMAKFWDPRMRTKIFAVVAQGRPGLLPRAQIAVERMIATQDHAA